ncbi:MAG: hypothetical protein K8J08_08395 [Thermoanaerobaculia bacterium]|nr:hypothetical protein [Thermoanaerobaculia bacterium]
MPAAASSGCGKVALLGCGFLVLLFGIGMIVFMIKANDALIWVFKKVEAEVEKGLPADLPAADRTRLRDAFAGLYAAVEEANVDPAALQRLQGKFMEMAPDIDNGLSVEQVRELTSALERVTGESVEEPRPEDQEESSEPLPTADRRGSPSLSPALA